MRKNQYRQLAGRPVMKMILIMGIMVGLMAGCGGQPDELPTNPQKVSADFPVVLLASQNRLYQPLFPLATQILPTSYRRAHSAIDKTGFRLASTLPLEGFDLTAEILAVSPTLDDADKTSSALSERLIYQFERPTVVEKKQYYYFNFSLDNQKLTSQQVSGVGLQVGQRYLLRLRLMKANRPSGRKVAEVRYYDLPFLYVKKSNQEDVISRVVEAYKADLPSASVVMNPAYPQIKEVDNQQSYEVQTIVSSALRQKEDFSYWQDTFVYEVDSQLKTKKKQHHRRNKYQANYDEEAGGFRFDKTADDNWQLSPNNRYLSYETDDQLYLYDRNKNELLELVRQDHLDSDYLYDELEHRRVKVLGWQEDRLLYCLMGTFHNRTLDNGRRGILFLSYGNEGIKERAFLEIPLAEEGLDEWVMDYGYHSEGNRVYYFFKDRVLYCLDLVSNQPMKVEVYPQASLYFDQGLLLWQERSDKYNQFVHWRSLNDVGDRLAERVDIGDKNAYRQLLAVTDRRIYIGQYDLEETLESLDRKVLYPFHHITSYQLDGQESHSFTADDYYGNIYTEDNAIPVVDIISRFGDHQPWDESKRLTYQKTGEQSLQEAVTNVPNIHAIRRTALLSPLQRQAEEVHQLTSQAGMEWLLSAEAVFKRPTYRQTDYRIVLNRQLETPYWRLEDGVTTYCYQELTSALAKGRELTEYRISQVTDVTTVVYDSRWLKTDHRIEGVPVISQRPELPRGCEVTALSVLLGYYQNERQDGRPVQQPEKMQLANELIKAEVYDNPIENRRYFVDMNRAFAGDMYDTNKSGLGVYIAPLCQLVGKYTQRPAFDLTGMTFNQLLTYVSHNQPVLVIVPNSYQAVSNYAMKQWWTANGYMEVTYQEHSVVVIGFDKQYVYYSDPSKVKIDRRRREDFRAAWQSMGNRAMVIGE